MLAWLDFHPADIRIVWKFNRLLSCCKLNVAGIVAINCKIHIKILLKFFIEIDPNEAVIYSRLELVNIKWGSKVRLHCSNSFDIAFISIHTQLKFYVRIAIASIILDLESSLRSWVNLKRVPPLMYDMHLKIASI